MSSMPTDQELIDKFKGLVEKHLEPIKDEVKWIKIDKEHYSYSVELTVYFKDKMYVRSVIPASRLHTNHNGLEGLARYYATKMAYITGYRLDPTIPNRGG